MGRLATASYADLPELRQSAGQKLRLRPGANGLTAADFLTYSLPGLLSMRQHGASKAANPRNLISGRLWYKVRPSAWQDAPGLRRCDRSILLQ
jgi:hypothetical protein